MSGKFAFVSKYDGSILAPISWSKLTRRQQQVLKLLLQGEQKKIALTLNISIRTVEKHRSFLMAKLNNPSATQLLAVAQKIGFIETLA